MLKTIIAASMLLTSVAMAGKPRTINNVEWLISNADKILTITKVELTDTATIVSFHSENKPNEWIRILKTAFLIGDGGKHYAAKYGIGITLSKRMYMPETGTADFKVVFEPLPRKTMFIDFVEGKNQWQIWGIHQKGTKLPAPGRTYIQSMKLTDRQSFFRSGTGVIRGKFTGGKRPAMISCDVDNFYTGNTYVAAYDVSDDGTFEVEIPVDNPIFDNISCGQFYLAAGDTLDITIDNNGTVAYPTTHEYARLLDLTTNINPEIRISYLSYSKKQKEMSPVEYDKWIGREADRLMTVADYIAKRHNLSPRETHLWKTDILMRCGITLLDYPQTKENRELLNDTDNYTFLRRMPTDDLTCLSLPFAMYYFCNRYQYSTPIFYGKNNNFANDSDDEPIETDKTLFGTDRPSLFLQTTWLYTKSYEFAYGRNPADVLKRIDKRKKHVTFEPAKARLDEIKQELAAPPISTYTLQEDKIPESFRAIMEKYRGKYVYIDFWGITCGPCRVCIEKSQQLRDSLAKVDDIELVFITGERFSGKKPYEEYVAKHLKGEEVYRVTNDEYTRLMALFGFNGIPHYELMAPDGRMIQVKDLRSKFDMKFDLFMNFHNKLTESLTQ